MGDQPTQAAEAVEQNPASTEGVHGPRRRRVWSVISDVCHDLAHMFGWVPFVGAVVGFEVGAIWLISRIAPAANPQATVLLSLVATGTVVGIAFEWWMDWQSHHQQVRAPAIATSQTRRRSQTNGKGRARRHPRQPSRPFEFERLITQTIDSLPPNYRDAMSNVDIVVEDEPPPGKNYLGLYQGIPLTVRNRRGGLWSYSMAFPDKISIYRGPIERYCAHNHLLLEREVRRVVLHEIAHHFGISDERLIEIGRY
jgi:predicted Zn-dependent protease with MMP-like domain